MAKLSHVDREGKARMVDIGAEGRDAAGSRGLGDQSSSAPRPSASSEPNRIAKGDVLNTARLAGHPGGQADPRAHPPGPPHPARERRRRPGRPEDRDQGPLPRHRRGQDGRRDGGPDRRRRRRPDDLRHGQGRGAGRRDRPAAPRLQERRQERGLPEKGMTAAAGGGGTIVSVNISRKKGQIKTPGRVGRARRRARGSKATPTGISATGRSRSS